MADDQRTEAPDDGDAARPRPSAAAAAASRARRIGGRPTVGAGAGGPAAAPATPASAEATAAPAAATSLTKTAPRREPEPAAPADEPAGRSADGPAPAATRAPAEIPAWLRWAPAGVLVAGALVMAVLLVVFSHGVWWAEPSAAAKREQVLAAAKNCVVQTNTYRYDKIADYRAKVRACTTGTLRGQIDKTITNVIQKYAPETKSVQTAQISRGALENVSSDGKQWTVLVFGQLNVTNSSDANGRVDPFAAQVRMEQVGGKWVMSDLKTVSN